MLNVALQYLCSKIGAPWVVTGTLGFAGSSGQAGTSHAGMLVMQCKPFLRCRQVTAMHAGYRTACKTEVEIALKLDRPHHA